MVFWRRLPKFEYLAPKTIEEALAILKDLKDQARVMAGGTDILVQMKNREITPAYLVGIKNISSLDYVEYGQNDGLRFGALSTVGSIENSSLIQKKYNILTQAVRSMASTQIRNVATIAGNLCSALPSADTAPALLVSGAKLKLRNYQGIRVVPIEEFFTGPRRTVLRDDELLTEIQVPDLTPDNKGVYLRHGLRKAMALASASVAVMMNFEDQYCKDIKIALGAVAPTPHRVARAEVVLRRQHLDDALIAEAARVASEEAQPISDIRASADYRRELVRVLTARAIKQACGRTKGMMVYTGQETLP
jgi:carbon-monoxide dehydrogenase medium subunit